MAEDSYPCAAWIQERAVALLAAAIEELDDLWLGIEGLVECGPAGLDVLGSVLDAHDLKQLRANWGLLDALADQDGIDLDRCLSRFLPDVAIERARSSLGLPRSRCWWQPDIEA